MTDSTNLLFLPGQNFDCAGCGRCCRSDWSVHVDPFSRDRISGSALELRVIQETGGPVLTEDQDGRLRTAYQDGSCVFLDADSLCRVHGEIGREAKPVSCLEFPFSILPTPDGVVVGASFYCPTVQKNEGRPLAAHEADIRALLERVRFHPVPETGIDLAPGHSVDWPGYRALEQALLEDLEDLLPEAALHRRLQALMTTVEGAGHPLPRQEPTWKAMQSFFVAALIGLVEAPEPKEAPATTEAVLAGGPLALERFGWKGEASQIAGYASEQAPAWLEGEIARYLKALVFRKFLVLGRPVLDNVALLCLLPPVLRWYTMASGLARGAERVAREDLHRAWDVTEFELVTHARGLDVLLAEFASASRRMFRTWSASLA